MSTGKDDTVPTRFFGRYSKRVIFLAGLLAAICYTLAVFSYGVHVGTYSFTQLDSKNAPVVITQDSVKSIPQKPPSTQLQRG